MQRLVRILRRGFPKSSSEDFWSLDVFTDKSSSKDYLPWAVVSNTVSEVFEKNIPSRWVAPSPMDLSTGLVYPAAKAAGDGEKSPDGIFQGHLHLKTVVETTAYGEKPLSGFRLMTKPATKPAGRQIIAMGSERSEDPR